MKTLHAIIVLGFVAQPAFCQISECGKPEIIATQDAERENSPYLTAGQRLDAGIPACQQNLELFWLVRQDHDPCPRSGAHIDELAQEFYSVFSSPCLNRDTETRPATGNSGSETASRPDRERDESPSPDSPAPPSTASSNKINSASPDLSPPESPAFTVLGLTPQSVTRPNTPAELATSLLNGFDRNGNFQTGMAIDTAPYMLFAGNSLTLFDYQRSPLKRFLARSQLSFGTTKGTSDPDKAVRLALGARFTIFDRGDPKNDALLIDCFDKNLKFDGPIPPNASTDDLQAALETKAQKCRKDASSRNWNASSWVVAAALAWISPDGNTGSFHLNGGGAWTAIAYGFEGLPSLSQRAQLIFEGVMRNKESFPNPKASGTFVDQNSRSVGGRFRFGSPTFNANVDGAYVTTKQPATLSENSYRVSVGVEHRLATKLWLNLTFARDSSTPTTSSHFTFLSGLTWNFSQQPTYPVP